MEIHPAERYDVPDDLHVITCIFNPSGYRSKLGNYERFAHDLRRSGLPLLTVECAFVQAPWQLPDANDILRVRSNSVLWQKERLLNVALAALPPHVKKVVWADADLLFSNPQWAVETSRLLETVPFAQPFQQWCRLPQNVSSYRGEGLIGDGFAYRSQTDPRAAWENRHGSPGFAWAARRDVLERHGFYDACIIGGGDSMIAHALNGSTDTNYVKRILGTLPLKPKGLLNRVKRRLFPPPATGDKFTDHYLRWATAIHADAGGSLGSVPGYLLHLWHGSSNNRNYEKRHEQMRRFDFDPDADLWKNADGAWEWSQSRADMQQWARDYFQQRREDG